MTNSLPASPAKARRSKLNGRCYSRPEKRLVGYMTGENSALTVSLAKGADDGGLGGSASP